MSLDEKGNILKGYVEDWEHLFRGVPNQPSFIKEDGSITSAILKDSHGGVSVDRDGGRNDSDVRGFCSLCGGVGRSLSSGFLLFPG